MNDIQTLGGSEGGPNRPVPLSATPRRSTRREFLIGTGGLLLLGGSLAGCGGGGRAGEEKTTEKRTIEHKYGSTEISGVPERVVSVGFNDQDPILALGVKPVGVRDWIENRIIWPWNEEEFSDAKPEILPVGELNFEQIATLKPDLIVGVYSGITKKEYETLSEIAPTVTQPGKYQDFGIPWQEQTRIIGRALGREERANKLVAEVEGRFARAREENPEFEGATGLVAYSFAPKEYGAYGTQDLRGRFLTSLGFELPPKIAELTGDEFFTTISGERLDLIDTDVLVWILSVDGTRETVEKDPLYRKLDVASEERAIFPSEELIGAISFSTVLSLPFALDGLVPMLAAAVDGNPATDAGSTS